MTTGGELVTLLSVPDKVYYQMVLNGMRDVEVSELCEEQAGFQTEALM